MTTEAPHGYFDAQLSLEFRKPTDSRKPVDVGLTIDLDGLGILMFEFTADQFAHLLAATVIKTEAYLTSDGGKK